jgi:hypothetical protein
VYQIFPHITFYHLTFRENICVQICSIVMYAVLELELLNLCLDNFHSGKASSVKCNSVLHFLWCSGP